MPRQKSTQPAESKAVETTGPEMELPEAISGAGTTPGFDAPTEQPPPGATGMSFADAATAMPSISPPAEALRAFGATTWHSDKRILATWSINQNRNAWVSINGIGWKRLAANSDSAIVALTMIGAHARQTQCRVDLREESDGMIHEIYAW